MVGARIALVLSVALVCAPAAAAVAAPARGGSFWLGPAFEGLPMTHEGPGFYVYGDCTPSSDAGCAPPLTVQNASTCDRNPVGLDIAHSRIFEVRGGAIAAINEPGQLDLTTARRSVTVFADTGRVAMAAVRALRRRSEEQPADRLSPPVYPAPVMREIKRVLVARARYPTLAAIARATGVPRFAVRTRLRLGRLLGRASFREVPEPRRPWSAVQRDRQAAFFARESGERQAAKDFGVSRAELRRMIRRVRGLAGRCPST